MGYWIKRTVTVVAVLLFGCIGSVNATTVGQSGSDWYLENDQLKVVVKPATGYITVYDKAIDKTWTQPGAVIQVLLDEPLT